MKFFCSNGERFACDQPNDISIDKQIFYVRSWKKNLIILYTHVEHMYGMLKEGNDSLHHPYWNETNHRCVILCLQIVTCSMDVRDEINLLDFK
jgi:hypothetical protein